MKISRGVLYMAASAFGFSVMSLFVKLAAKTLPTGEIVLARSLVTLVLSFVMVRRASLPGFGTQRGKLILRGVLGFGGLAGYYIAIAHLQLAEATTLQNIVPVLTAVLAWLVLDEKVGWTTGVALVLGLVGVTVVAHPHFGEALDPVGIAGALGGAACSSVAYVTVRQLSRTEHPLVIVMYFPLVATPLAIPWAASDFVMPHGVEWLWLVGLGAATQVGQVFLTMGLAAERAGRASSVNYLQVCFAIGWQLAVFDVVPSPRTLVGAAFIVAGTLAAAARR